MVEGNFAAASAVEEVVSIGINEFVAFLSSARGANQSSGDNWESQFALDHDGE